MPSRLLRGTVSAAAGIVVFAAVLTAGGAIVYAVTSTFHIGPLGTLFLLMIPLFPAERTAKTVSARTWVRLNQADDRRRRRHGHAGGGKTGSGSPGDDQPGGQPGRPVPASSPRQ
jgi:hypothetical protein